MMYLLDTDIFTLAYYNKQGIRERILSADGLVAISVITRIEVLRGRFESVSKAADGSQLLRALDVLFASEAYLTAFPLAPILPSFFTHFDQLREQMPMRKLFRGDLLIAYIALAHDATLVSRNTKDFVAISGLKLANWSE